MVERGFTKIGFLLMFVDPIVWFVFLYICCFLDQVLGIGYSISCIFFAKSMALFKFQKGKLGIIRLG